VLGRQVSLRAARRDRRCAGLPGSLMASAKPRGSMIRASMM